MNLGLLKWLMPFWLMLAMAQAEELQLITSAQSDFSEINEVTLRNLYLGREKFVGSQPVQIVDFNNAQGIFLERYVRKKKKAYRRLWHMMVFTGKSLAPKEFRSKEELYAFIAKTKNVIGYTIYPVDHEGLKILKLSQ